MEDGNKRERQKERHINRGKSNSNEEVKKTREEEQS